MKILIDKLFRILGYAPVQELQFQKNHTLKLQRQIIENPPKPKQIIKVNAEYIIPQDEIIGHINPKLIEERIKHEVNQKLLSMLTEVVEYEMTERTVFGGSEYIIRAKLNVVK